MQQPNHNSIFTTIEPYETDELDFYFVYHTAANTFKKTLQYTVQDKKESFTLPILIIARQDIISLVTLLRLSSQTSVDTALDCAALDTPSEQFRFTVLYFLQSSTQNYAVRVVTKASEVHPTMSLQGIYPALNWGEREMWDMTGVITIKHPDLRRILTDYGFVGHPVTKTFPLSGFKEHNFSGAINQIVSNPVELSQSSRQFILESSASWS